TLIPPSEPERMAAVNRYEVLDTPPDGVFDRITSLAARLFGVPISIISIVDHDRIWFKSRHGVDVTEIPREPGLCASAILSPDPHILPDASVDPRSLANPLVAGDFGLRFYAGVPLTTDDGHNLGTLCVIDKVARPITQDQIEDLKDLASLVIDQLELRMSARRAVAQKQLMAREIDHRVTNSLQFVSGLLTMQSRASNDDHTTARLQDAATRVAAVARVHRHFASSDSDQVSALAFLRRLCADLSDICDTPIHVTGDEGDVPTTLILPIGLIANEFITNAVKHGGGRIGLTYAIDGAEHSLCVCDEGPGPPSDVTAGTARGLGMKVIETLTRQLEGKLTAVANPTGRGSCFTVKFTA
ncbi:MAG TPA: histidine kinase dimerization/phosphoacceptor domain -containing protein, partial [Sphingomicrobium sp.]|nr:histidine kinase dimerization/phosphoacceptor domain -containing protein [Sphingomicrobium sp.]